MAEFLATRGFQRTAPDTFSNGRAMLRFDRCHLHAVPEDRTKGWLSDLLAAEPETVRQLLTHLLAAPSFQS